MGFEHLQEDGTWRIFFGQSPHVMADVRLEHRDGKLRVYLRELGEGEWVENEEALDLVVFYYDYGRMIRLDEGEADGEER